MSELSRKGIFGDSKLAKLDCQRHKTSKCPRQNKRKCKRETSQRYKLPGVAKGKGVRKSENKSLQRKDFRLSDWSKAATRAGAANSGYSIVRKYFDLENKVDGRLSMGNSEFRSDLRKGGKAAMKDESRGCTK